MWKAAFTGRSEMSSAPARSSTERKKSRGSESVVSSSSRKPEEEGRRHKTRSGTYDGDYQTIPRSRISEPRSLTESAVRTLDDNEEDWEDDDKAARSERRSSKIHSRRGPRDSRQKRSRSPSREPKDDSRKQDDRRRSQTSRNKSRTEGNNHDRAIPEMGSFSQFPGQYAGGVMGSGGMQDQMMSGAGPSSAPINQFGLTRADSYGHAADYYLDEGQSVASQPGYRKKSPNMLSNPDQHLVAASEQENPAQDTGQGSAAGFYNNSETFGSAPQSRPNRPGKQASSSSRPSRPGRTTSLPAAASVAAAGLGAAGVAPAFGGGSQFQARPQRQSQYGYTASSTSYQQQGIIGQSSSRPPRPDPGSTISGEASSYYTASPQPADSSAYGAYYDSTSQQGYTTAGKPGKQPSSSNVGLYAAGAAAAGLAAYEVHEQHQQQQNSNNMASPDPQYSASQYGRPAQGQQNYTSTSTSVNTTDNRFHEHKGPITRLKDGFLNLISSEEDVIKMEIYTEYIGVCKYCFDPRTTPYDAPRVHHHHHGPGRRDSFDSLRKRRSHERMHKSSKGNLGRTTSSRIDKDNRYYSSDGNKRRQSTGKAGVVGAGLAAVGAVAGANAIFRDDRKDFDDTYSVKSGRRESSATRHRSRSSSRERRRRSSCHTVAGAREDEYVNVRTKDGRVERRKVRRSRSGSKDRSNGLIGGAAGAALGASAVAAVKSQRDDDQTSAGRRRSRSSSNSDQGFFGGFFSPSWPKRKDSTSRRRKKQGGFFSFGGGSTSSSDVDMAFGERFNSQTNLPLRRKSSVRSTKASRRKRSDEHLAATIAGIGTTAAALAAAQKGPRSSKRAGMPELGARRLPRKQSIHAHRHGSPSPSDSEWEDELPSDVDDGSSVGSDLAFGDYDNRLRKRQSADSFSSQSSNGGLSAWGWRWGGRDNKKKPKKPRSTPPPAYVPPVNVSPVDAAAAAVAAGAVASTTEDATSRWGRTDSMGTSTSGLSQRPMREVDPRPLSDAGSLPDPRYATMPGAFDSSSPSISRPGPAPLQQPKPISPFQPAFVESPTATEDYEDARPSKPRRTQSSPVQSSSLAKDAALIGAAALGTAGIIASQGQKSKQSANVRFGLTEEQERKQERARQRESEKADEERQRVQRTEALKREAGRHTREQDVLRAREAENRKAAEAELEKQRAVREEAEARIEADRRREYERRNDEEAFRRQEARQADEQSRVEDERRQREDESRREQARQDRTSLPREREIQQGREADSHHVQARLAGEQRQERERRELELQAEAERRCREAEDEQYTEEPRSWHQREAGHDVRQNSEQASVPWGVIAAGAANAGAGAYAMNQYGHGDDNDAVSDDDVYEENYLTRSRSDSDYARRVELSEKTIDDLVADRDAYYHEPEQSQAEFFAPDDILAEKPGGKTKVADPIDDNNVYVYNAGEDPARSQFERDWAVGPAGRSRAAPYGVPKLGLVTPTPPPAVTLPVDKRSSRSSSPLVSSEIVEEDVASSPRGPRSISWGADQTHVYDGITPSPDAQVDKSAYIDEYDVVTPIAAATAAVGVATVVEALHKTTDPSESLVDAAQEPESEREPPMGTSSAGFKIPRATPSSFYQQPFYESASDIDLRTFVVETPGTEGAPPVVGFVEGEVDEPTPPEEKDLHIPGGFDDEDEQAPRAVAVAEEDDAAATRSAAARLVKGKVDDNTEITRSAADVPVEPEDVWEPPLSKKEKKKREKAAMRENIETSTPVSDESMANTIATASVVPRQDAPLTKKEKLKRDKALQRGFSRDQSSSSTLPLDEPQVEDMPVVPSEPIADEPAWEPPLTKKEKKKREKEAKRQGFSDVAATVMTAGGIAAVTAAVPNEVEASRQRKVEERAQLESRARDLEPAKQVERETDADESRFANMPGSWEEKGQDILGVSPGSEVLDVFQFQVHDQPDADELHPAVAVSSVPGARGKDRNSAPNDSEQIFAPNPTTVANGTSETRDISSSQEPEVLDESRSVAVSEPTDYYEGSSKAKRRSRREETGDTASATSSRSKRELKERDNKKSNQTGFFGGLFGRKAMESVSTGRNEPELDRATTKDAAADEFEDKDRRRRRRKSRDSAYETNETATESRRERRSSQYDDDVEDDDGYSQASSQNHRRRSTNESTADQDQSFLGTRVESTPPLPTPAQALEDAALMRNVQGVGAPASAAIATEDVVPPSAPSLELGIENQFAQLAAGTFASLPDSEREHEAKTIPGPDGPETEVEATLRALNGRHEGNEALPIQPDPGLDFSSSVAEGQTRRRSLDRPVSATAVPVRFHFGSQPSTPGSRAERSTSFGLSTPSSPASPMSAHKSRHGRHMSSEPHPLYLVESNRKIPEVEEGLPSLPSSKTTSRASSIIDGDGYESAPEDLSSPSRRRGLAIDTTSTAYQPDSDYLDSQQTTPKANEFPPAVLERPARPAPEFWKWEDYIAQARSMQDTTGDQAVNSEVHEDPRNVNLREPSETRRHDMRTEESDSAELPPLPRSRSQSPIDNENEPNAGEKLAAAAAAIGGAAAVVEQALAVDDEIKDHATSYESGLSDEPAGPSTMEAEDDLDHFLESKEYLEAESTATPAQLQTSEDTHDNANESTERVLADNDRAVNTASPLHRSSFAHGEDSVSEVISEPSVHSAALSDKTPQTAVERQLHAPTKDIRSYVRDNQAITTEDQQMPGFARDGAGLANPILPVSAAQATSGNSPVNTIEDLADEDIVAGRSAPAPAVTSGLDPADAVDETLSARNAAYVAKLDRKQSKKEKKKQAKNLATSIDTPQDSFEDPGVREIDEELLLEDVAPMTRKQSKKAKKKQQQQQIWQKHSRDDDLMPEPDKTDGTIESAGKADESSSLHAGVEQDSFAATAAVEATAEQLHEDGTFRSTGKTSQPVETEVAEEAQIVEEPTSSQPTLEEVWQNIPTVSRKQSKKDKRKSKKQTKWGEDVTDETTSFDDKIGGPSASAADPRERELETLPASSTEAEITPRSGIPPAVPEALEPSQIALPQDENDDLLEDTSELLGTDFVDQHASADRSIQPSSTVTDQLLTQSGDQDRTDTASSTSRDTFRVDFEAVDPTQVTLPQDDDSDLQEQLGQDALYSVDSVGHTAASDLFGTDEPSVRPEDLQSQSEAVDEAVDELYDFSAPDTFAGSPQTRGNEDSATVVDYIEDAPNTQRFGDRGSFTESEALLRHDQARDVEDSRMEDAQSADVFDALNSTDAGPEATGLPVILPLTESAEASPEDATPVPEPEEQPEEEFMWTSRSKKKAKRDKKGKKSQPQAVEQDFEPAQEPQSASQLSSSLVFAAPAEALGEKVSPGVEQIQASEQPEDEWALPSSKKKKGKKGRKSTQAEWDEPQNEAAPWEDDARELTGDVPEVSVTSTDDPFSAPIAPEVGQAPGEDFWSVPSSKKKKKEKQDKKGKNVVQQDEAQPETPVESQAQQTSASVEDAGTQKPATRSEEPTTAGERLQEAERSESVQEPISSEAPTVIAATDMEVATKDADVHGGDPFYAIEEDGVPEEAETFWTASSSKKKKKDKKSKKAAQRDDFERTIVAESPATEPSEFVDNADALVSAPGGQDVAITSEHTLLSEQLESFEEAVASSTLDMVHDAAKDDAATRTGDPLAAVEGDGVPEQAESSWTLPSSKKKKKDKKGRKSMQTDWSETETTAQPSSETVAQLDNGIGSNNSLVPSKDIVSATEEIKQVEEVEDPWGQPVSSKKSKKSKKLTWPNQDQGDEHSAQPLVDGLDQEVIQESQRDKVVTDNPNDELGELSRGAEHVDILDAPDDNWQATSSKKKKNKNKKGKGAPVEASAEENDLTPTLPLTGELDQNATQPEVAADRTQVATEQVNDAERSVPTDLQVDTLEHKDVARDEQASTIEAILLIEQSHEAEVATNNAGAVSDAQQLPLLKESEAEKTISPIEPSSTVESAHDDVIVPATIATLPSEEIGEATRSASADNDEMSPKDLHTTDQNAALVALPESSLSEELALQESSDDALTGRAIESDDGAVAGSDAKEAQPSDAKDSNDETFEAIASEAIDPQQYLDNPSEHLVAPAGNSNVDNRDIEATEATQPDADAEQRIADPEVAEADEADFAWTVRPSKKKKGKKGKGQENARDVQAVELEPGDLDGSAPLAESSWTGEVAREVGAEDCDSWAAPVKGRKNKGKGKKSGLPTDVVLDTSQVPNTAVAQESSIVEDGSYPGESKGNDAFDPWASVSNTKKGTKSKKGKKSLWQTKEFTPLADGDLPGQSDVPALTVAEASAEIVDDGSTEKVLQQDRAVPEFDQHRDETSGIGKIQGLDTESLPPLPAPDNVETELEALTERSLTPQTFGEEEPPPSPTSHSVDMAEVRHSSPLAQTVPDTGNVLLDQLTDLTQGHSEKSNVQADEPKRVSTEIVQLQEEQRSEEDGEVAESSRDHLVPSTDEITNGQASVDEPSDVPFPPEQDETVNHETEQLSFTTKRSKRDKKKAQRSGFLMLNAPEDEPVHGSSRGGDQAEDRPSEAGAAAASVTSFASMPVPEPTKGQDDDLWPAFSVKRSKKDKRKGKRSGMPKALGENGKVDVEPGEQANEAGGMPTADAMELGQETQAPVIVPSADSNLPNDPILSVEPAASNSHDTTEMPTGDVVELGERSQSPVLVSDTQPVSSQDRLLSSGHDSATDTADQQVCYDAIVELGQTSQSPIVVPSTEPNELAASSTQDQLSVSANGMVSSFEATHRNLDDVEDTHGHRDADVHEEPAAAATEITKDTFIAPLVEDDTAGTRSFEQPSAEDTRNDIDFAATVAAGLADSGFDAGLVADDPGFSRRMSPPATISEAVPEEAFTMASKKKKKSKRGKSTETHVQPEATVQVSRTASKPDEQDAQDDFDNTLEQTLAGSGFDSALVEQLNSSRKTSPSNDVGDRADEFSFTTTKRRKSKKVREPQTESETETTQRMTASEDIDRTCTSEPHADAPPGSSGNFIDISTTTRTLPEITEGASEDVEDFGVDAAHVSDQDMDVDEMDRKYKEFKRKQRDRKKKKAGLADVPVTRAALNTAEAERIASPQRDRERSLGLLPGEYNDLGIDRGIPRLSAVPPMEEASVSESPLIGSKEHAIIRDSGYQETSSPVVRSQSFDGYAHDPHTVHKAQSYESLHSRRSADPLQISTATASPDWSLNLPKTRTGDKDKHEGEDESLQARSPSRETAKTPLESTTKNRASYLFQSTPEILRDPSPVSDQATPLVDFDRSEYFPLANDSRLSKDQETTRNMESLDHDHSAFSPPPAGPMSPRLPLDTIMEEGHAQKRLPADSDIGGPDHIKAVRRGETPQSIRARERIISPAGSTQPASTYIDARSLRSPLPVDEVFRPTLLPTGEDSHGADENHRSLKRRSSRQVSGDLRSASSMSNRSTTSSNYFRPPEDNRSFSRSSNRSNTPTLRRSNRSLSGDLRAAALRGDRGTGSSVGARSSPKTIPFEPPPTPPSNDDEVTDAGASRSVDMSDVYVGNHNLRVQSRTDPSVQHGYGDAQASQISPTRPPTMRKRQSMHIMELESRLDTLIAQNQALQDARQGNARSIGDSNVNDPGLQRALDEHVLRLRGKDSEINQIRALLQPMQSELERLTEINEGLTEANRNLVDDTNGRYATLQQEHAHAHEQWQDTNRELESLRQEHGRMTTGMREAVEAEIAAALADKNSELRTLREELSIANERIRALQVQIQATRGRDFLTTRDEDYFDGACQKLCQHVRQWVLRFSKLSDNRICRLSTSVKDDKIEARLDNAILDGSDVDKLLVDRVKRRDVFMSVVMTMVWEYVFTRYLFGMDREQRQKLKTLEKTLAEVGPARAVAQWRATTLTLLAKRPAFAQQRDLDQEAVANEIFNVLSALLPPPSNAEQQLLESLKKVIGIAVDLSIEMRCQRAEYIMLPPLQPEYDTNGDLVRQVHFNASLMSERSGLFGSNAELEEADAVVKIVLFPLVVKKGNEVGEGEEEVVVCPAQVLVQNENGKGKRIVRVQSGAMEIDDGSRDQGSLVTDSGSMAF